MRTAHYGSPHQISIWRPAIPPEVNPPEGRHTLWKQTPFESRPPHFGGIPLTLLRQTTLVDRQTSMKILPPNNLAGGNNELE